MPEADAAWDDTPDFEVPERVADAEAVDVMPYYSVNQHEVMFQSQASKSLRLITGPRDIDSATDLLLKENDGMTLVSTSRPTPSTRAPFSSGQWVAENQDFQHPEIGYVKDVYWDDIVREWVMDVALYSPDGEKIGRKTPRMGGPCGFEPALPCQSWRLIRRPEFPLGRDATGYRDWKSSLDYIETTAPADRGPG